MKKTVTVVRSVLTPKVMARQTQAPPIAVLAAMYVGFRAMGVGGLLLLPLALLFGAQLWSSGALGEIRAFLRQQSVVEFYKME